MCRSTYVTPWVSPQTIELLEDFKGVRSQMMKELLRNFISICLRLWISFGNWIKVSIQNHAHIHVVIPWGIPQSPLKTLTSRVSHPRILVAIFAMLVTRWASSCRSELLGEYMGSRRSQDDGSFLIGSLKWCLDMIWYEILWWLLTLEEVRTILRFRGSYLT